MWTEAVPRQPGAAGRAGVHSACRHPRVLPGLLLAATGCAAPAAPAGPEAAPAAAAAATVSVRSESAGPTAAIGPRDADWNPQERRADTGGGVHYLIGISARSGPDFFGGGSGHGLRPVLAVEWGRLRLSTGGGWGLMEHGRSRRRDRSVGLEGLLRATDRFNLSLSLNIDRGRGVAETDRRLGVPNVPTTLRARVRARYNLSERWTTSLAVSQDVLGKGGGMVVDAWLGHDQPLGPRTTVGASLTASWGNARYMRSEFGIPLTPQRIAAGLSGYRPRAGLFQTGLGLDLTHSISEHWVAFGGIGYTRLQDDAARSPLVRRRGGFTASIGLAWRN